MSNSRQRLIGLLFVAITVVSASCNRERTALPLRLDNDGDPLPPYALCRLGSRRFLTPTGCWAIAISPDGKYVATGTMPGQAGPVVIFETESGQIVHTLVEWCVNGIDLAWTSDGRTVIASYDGGLESFDAATGQSRGRFLPDGRPQDSLWDIGISADSRLVTAYSPRGDQVGLWTIDRAKVFIERAHFEIDALAISADGRHLAVGGMNQLEIWEVADPSQRRRIVPGGTVVSLAFHPDGETVTAAVHKEPDTKTCCLKSWGIEDVELLAESESFSATYADIAYFNAGQQLVSGGYATEIIVWNSASLDKVREVGDRKYVGTYIAVACERPIVAAADPRIGIWNLESGETLTPTSPHAKFVNSVVFTRDGTRVLTSAGDGISYWDAESGEHQDSVEGVDGALALTLSPDGNTFAAAIEGSIGLWDVESAEQIGTLRGHTPRDSRFAASSLAFSPDGNRLVSAGKEIIVWDVASRTETNRIDVMSVWSDAQFADESSLWYAGWGANAIVRLAMSGDRLDRITRVNADGDNCFCLSPDGQLLAALQFEQLGGEVYYRTGVYQLPSTQLLWQTPRSRGGSIGRYAFSPDGAIVAAGTGTTLQLWSRSGKRLAVVSNDGHSEHITCVAFSADGKRLASASNDTTVMIWDVESALAGGKARD